MPRFTRVMIMEMPTDTAMLRFMYEIPILMPRDAPNRPIVASQAMNLRKTLSSLGNPMLFHFISYGSGAFLISTSLIGKSLSLKNFQNLKIEMGALFYSISSRALEYRIVTNMRFLSSKGTLGNISFSKTSE